MKEFLESHWSRIVGLGVFLILLATSELGIFSLGSTEIEKRLMALFIGIGTAILLESVTRAKEVRQIVRDEILRSQSNTTRLTVFSTGDDAYEYLTKQLPKVRKVFNTIVSKEAYTDRGMNAPSNWAKHFHETKIRVIKSSTVAWEDIVSANYVPYVRYLRNEHFNALRMKYSAFEINNSLDFFDNFIVLEYEDGRTEVIIGWVMLHNAITNVDELYLIQNSYLPTHYKKYFCALREHACKPIT